MSNNEKQMPQNGDRVRVVMEGEVQAVTARQFNLGSWRDCNVIRPEAEHVVSVEILPRPMPTEPRATGTEYSPQVGDLVSATGRVQGINSEYRWASIEGVGTVPWDRLTFISRPMPPLPTKPTPIVATVGGEEGVLLMGPSGHGNWSNLHPDGGRYWYSAREITAWRFWTPEDSR